MLVLVVVVVLVRLFPVVPAKFPPLALSDDDEHE
jgi:hypothetical protein